MRDPHPAALLPLWLVFAVPQVDVSGSGQRFIAFDPERQAFGLGSWEGATAWYEGDSGSSFLALLEQLLVRVDPTR